MRCRARSKPGGPLQKPAASLQQGGDRSKTQIAGISVLPKGSTLMRYEDASTPERDSTLQDLTTVIDGSLSGLAHYHLLRQELDNIRELPERRDRDRVPAPPG